MDLLKNICRYTGETYTEGTAADFKVCPVCGGVTAKRALVENASRCSYDAYEFRDYSKVLGVAADLKALLDFLPAGDQTANIASINDAYDLVMSETIADVMSDADYYDLIDDTMLAYGSMKLLLDVNLREDVSTLEEAFIRKVKEASYVTTENSADFTEFPNSTYGDESAQDDIIENLNLVTELYTIGQLTDYETAISNLDDLITNFIDTVRTLPEVLTDFITSVTEIHTAAVEGTGLDEYLAGSKATLNGAIIAAQVVVDDTESTNEELSTAIDDLSTAQTVFINGKVTQLDSINLIVITAQELHDGATEGTDAGEYEVGSKTVLLTEIDRASIAYQYTNGMLLDLPNLSEGWDLMFAYIRYLLQDAIDIFNAGRVIVPITEIATIVGTPEIGVELTAGALTPIGGTVSYQWKICATNNGDFVSIDGETTNAYTPVTEDLGKFLKVTVVGTGNYSGTITSASSTAITQEPITAIASIVGTPQTGVELTTGVLTPIGATVTYQWKICDTAEGEYTNIEGATTNAYTPIIANETKFLKVAATGTGIYSGSVTSAASAAVIAA